VRKVFGKKLGILHLVSHDFHTRLVDTEDLSVDSGTVAAKKGRSRRLATTVMTGRRKESRYMQ
jgi:hypothetical protein